MQFKENSKPQQHKNRKSESKERVRRYKMSFINQRQTFTFKSIQTTNKNWDRAYRVNKQKQRGLRWISLKWRRSKSEGLEDKGKTGISPT